MPKAENAILDPFSAMAPTEAIMVAVCGIVVVFLMLAILALVIRINSKLVSLLEGKKETAAPAPVAKPAAPAAAPAPAAPAVGRGAFYCCYTSTASKRKVTGRIPSVQHTTEVPSFCCQGV